MTILQNNIARSSTLRKHQSAGSAVEHSVYSHAQPAMLLCGMTGDIASAVFTVYRACLGDAQAVGNVGDGDDDDEDGPSRIKAMGTSD